VRARGFPLHFQCSASTTVSLVRSVAYRSCGLFAGAPSKAAPWPGAAGKPKKRPLTSSSRATPSSPSLTVVTDAPQAVSGKTPDPHRPISELIVSPVPGIKKPRPDLRARLVSPRYHPSWLFPTPAGRSSPLKPGNGGHPEGLAARRPCVLRLRGGPGAGRAGLPPSPARYAVPFAHPSSLHSRCSKKFACNCNTRPDICQGAAGAAATGFQKVSR